MSRSKLFLSRLRTSGPNSQTSDAECFRSKAKMFLNKKFDPTLPIPQSLPLTVALDQLRVLLAVLFLVVAMFVLPLLLAVAHHLEILWVCCQLLAVIIAASPTLALRPTAHGLLRTISRG